MQTFKEIEKYYSILTDNKVKCKCGKSIAFSSRVDRIICDWCGHWCYKTPQLEFKYKLKERMIKNARK